MIDEIVKEFLERISPIRDKILEIYLFGSRCRDDWRPDSDYDILIILEKRDRETIDKLYDIAIDILIETGRVLSYKIFTQAEFNRLKSMRTPFIENVMREGIRLG